MRRQGLDGFPPPGMELGFLVWYPHPELNGNPRFRKPLLYPFELWGRDSRKNTPAAADGKSLPLCRMTNS